MKPGQLLRWWRAPLWVLALGTGAKSFKDNPILGSARLNRAGLHATRVKAAHGLAWWRRRRLAPAVPAEYREQFDKDGFVCIADFLPQEAFERLRSDLLQTALDSREHQQGDTITRRTAIGPDLLATFPQLDALLKSPRWKSLLAYVASNRSEPLYYVQTIVGSAVEGPPDPQVNLHSDTFHPSLKAWLFLTNVADDDRPLTYVAGSHRRDAARLAWERKRSLEARDGQDFLSGRGSLRIDESELAALGLPQPTSFAVPSNTLVVCDTSGFHARGPAVRPSTRVEMWAYGRRNPFLPWTGLDLTGWPGLAERRVPIHWAFRDRFKRWIGQPWTDAGRKRPADG